MENVHAGGMLYELARATSRRLLFYCAFGERSAMAVRAAHGAGLGSACHIKGGINAWKKAGGPLEHVLTRRELDCFVASLLAMTSPPSRHCERSEAIQEFSGF